MIILAIIPARMSMVVGLQTRDRERQAERNVDIDRETD
jgi:hypothetical protein